MRENVVSWKSQIKNIVFVTLLMAITIFVILKEYSLNMIIQTIQGTHPIYLIAGIFAMFLFNGCQAMSFFIILKKLRSPTSLLRCYEYACVGYYYGGITPGASGSQPSQLYYMYKDGIPIDISSITAIIVTLARYIAVLGMGCVYALLRPEYVSDSEPGMKYLLLFGAIILLASIIALIAMMFMKKVVSYFFVVVMKAGVKLHLIKDPETTQAKFDAFILSYSEKAKVLLKYPDLFVKVLVVNIVQYIFFFHISYLVYLSFGYKQYNAIDLMAGQALISVAISALPIPGAVGVAEKSYLNYFGRFYLPQELPSSMILTRFLNFYLPLFINFYISLMVHYRVVKQKKQKDIKQQ